MLSNCSVEQREAVTVPNNLQDPSVNQQNQAPFSSLPPVASPFYPSEHTKYK